MIFAVGIGSNLGNRYENISKSIFLLKEKGIKILNVSLVYQSKALVRIEDIENVAFDINFLNVVIICNHIDEEKCSPEEVLQILKKVETRIGKKDDVRWSPRIIDLDLLFFDSLIVNEKNLIIPHPEIENRSFVMLPLLQVAPKWLHPNPNSRFYSKTIAQIYQEKFFNATENFINTTPFSPQLMAIVNLTPDSCTNDGYLQSKTIDINKICEEIWRKFTDGASILDFGAQSTRPNFTILPPEIEIERMKIILDVFFREYYFKSRIFPTISIDTFYPEVVKHCIENYKVDIINDVSGLTNLNLLDCVVDSDRKIVLMHNLPLNSQNIISHEYDIFDELIEWFERKIEIIMNYTGGTIKKEQIILDPGIGFGKTVHQQWEIIRNIEKLRKKLKIPVLFGHSKKSFLKTISGDYTERSNQTFGISLKVAKYVDYLRIHDVKLHAEALSASEF